MRHFTRNHLTAGTYTVCIPHKRTAKIVPYRCIRTVETRTINDTLINRVLNFVFGA